MAPTPSVFSSAINGKDSSGSTPPTRPSTHCPPSPNCSHTQSKTLSFILQIPKTHDNVASIHQGFIDLLFTVLCPDTVLHPTNKETNPTPSPIRKLSDHPGTDIDHHTFYHREESRGSRRTNLHHTITLDVDIDELKQRVIPYLKNMLYGSPTNTSRRLNSP